MAGTTEVNGVEPQPVLFDGSLEEHGEDDHCGNRGPTPGSGPRRRKRGTKLQRVLAHLVAGHSLTQGESEALFGTVNLAAMVSFLINEDNWPVRSHRSKDENGKWFTTYWMAEEAVRRDPAPETPPDISPKADLLPEPEPPGPENYSHHVETDTEVMDIAVRLGPTGPRLEVNGVRYAMTPMQMRMLAMNMHFLADEVGQL